MKTQKSLPHIEKVKGNVIFVASIYGENYGLFYFFARSSAIGFALVLGTQPVKKCIDYNTSKAAMKMMARIFALEEAPKGVRARASWNGFLSQLFSMFQL